MFYKTLSLEKFLNIDVPNMKNRWKVVKVTLLTCIRKFPNEVKGDGYSTYGRRLCSGPYNMPYLFRPFATNRTLRRRPRPSHLLTMSKDLSHKKPRIPWTTSLDSSFVYPSLSSSPHSSRVRPQGHPVHPLSQVLCQQESLMSWQDKTIK